MLLHHEHCTRGNFTDPSAHTHSKNREISYFTWGNPPPPKKPTNFLAGKDILYFTRTKAQISQAIFIGLSHYIFLRHHTRKKFFSQNSHQEQGASTCTDWCHLGPTVLGERITFLSLCVMLRLQLFLFPFFSSFSFLSTTLQKAIFGSLLAGSHIRLFQLVMKTCCCSSRNNVLPFAKKCNDM